MKRLLWCAVLLTACGEPTIPSRSDIYTFASGGDVFHWPAGRLPVRFWAEPGGPTSLVDRGVAVWQSQFLYGELSGVLVPDSNHADVIVLVTGSVPDVPPDPGPPVAACNGVTTIPGVDATNTFTDKLYVHLSVAGGYTPSQVVACLRRTTIHELGHALGLFQHSLDPADIMYAPPQVDVPSERDHRTVEVLYHTPPTVLPYAP